MKLSKKTIAIIITVLEAIAIVGLKHFFTDNITAL